MGAEGSRCCDPLGISGSLDPTDSACCGWASETAEHEGPLDELKGKLCAIFRTYSASDRDIFRRNKVIKEHRIEHFKSLLIEVSDVPPGYFSGLRAYTSTTSLCHVLFQVFDQDKDGEISEDEFYRTLCLFADTDGVGREDRMKLLFHAIDTNRNGYITHGELAQFVEHVAASRARMLSATEAIRPDAADPLDPSSSTGAGAPAGPPSTATLMRAVSTGDRSWNLLSSSSTHASETRMNFSEFKTAIEKIGREDSGGGLDVGFVQFLKQDELFRVTPRRP